MSDLYAPARFPIARKDYRCEQCRTKIAKGEKHLYRPWKDGHRINSYRAHQDCEHAASDLEGNANLNSDEGYLLHECADKTEDGPYIMQHYPAVYSRLFVRNPT